MAARASDYDSWSLQDLREEASKRSIYFSSKDGVRTLARNINNSTTWEAEIVKLYEVPGKASQR